MILIIVVVVVVVIVVAAAAAAAVVFVVVIIQVVDMDTMKHIMRFNNYEEDPYSLSNPMYTICSRGDLLSPPRDGGCIDTKV